MLYVIGVPIGNLKDITVRALEILKIMDAIICETRSKTIKLLTHYGITGKKLVDIHDFKSIGRLLETDCNIGLIVEAGTAAISDPGQSVIALANERKIKVACIPGVSALTAAISVCPFKISDFVFTGFLPKKAGRLKKLLDKYTGCVVAAFESPHRIKKTLTFLSEISCDRRLFIARELTKVYESFYTGTARELAEQVPEKGEITIIFDRKDA